MKRFVLCAAIAAAVLLLPAKYAAADHRHHGRHNRGYRSSVYVSVGGYGGYGSNYYSPYYSSSYYSPRYYAYPSYGPRYSSYPSYGSRYYAYPTYGYSYDDGCY